GVPGVLVPEGDRVRLAPRMPGLQSPEVLARLHDAVGVDVHVENDVNLAATAELAKGRGRQSPDFVYLSVGTGVGLALVLGAQLLAAGIATVCAIVDPGMVVLGGGLGVGGADLLLPLLHKALRRLTPLRPTVVASELGNHAVLDGAVVDAVAHAQETVLGTIT